jgi:hypothetical protein
MVTERRRCRKATFRLAKGRGSGKATVRVTMVRSTERRRTVTYTERDRTTYTERDRTTYTERDRTTYTERDRTVTYTERDRTVTYTERDRIERS